MKQKQTKTKEKKNVFFFIEIELKKDVKKQTNNNVRNTLSLKQKKDVFGIEFEFE